MFLSDAPVGASFKVVQVLLAREVGKRLRSEERRVGKECR